MYLDFNLVENLTVVDTNHGTDHLGDDDHVTEVGLDNLGLLVLSGGELGLTQTLDESEGLALKTAVEATTSTAVNEVDELKKRINIKCKLRSGIPAQWG